MTGDGKSEAEVRRRIQVGANAWRREEGGGSNGRQKDRKEIEREDYDVVCNGGLPLWSGNVATDQETTTEAAGLGEQLGQEDCGSEVKENG